MDKQVLVAYATKHGSTAEISARIGRALQDAGLTTDVMPVDDVSDVTRYTAVVLGSAVYVGRWRKEATRFLEEHEAALAQRDVWLFSSGPTGEGDPVEQLEGWRLPEKLQPAADRIGPHDIAVFQGVLDADKLNFVERFMINAVKAPTGDFRDWEAIDAWAKEIAASLAP